MISHPHTVSILVSRLPHAEDLRLPSYLTPGSAGMDLHAAVESKLELSPGRRTAVPTGLTIALPLGYEAQVRSRSGLVLKHGIVVLNAPGTVDSDFRGEIKVILANLSDESFLICRGDRIAQMVIAQTVQAIWKEAKHLPESSRGEGGFGHTGI